MNENRKIIINLLPQGEGAWLSIAMATFFISVAMCVRGCWDAVAREREANALLGKSAVEAMPRPQ